MHSEAKAEIVSSFDGSVPYTAPLTSMCTQKKELLADNIVFLMDRVGILGKTKDAERSVGDIPLSQSEKEEAHYNIGIAAIKPAIAHHEIVNKSSIGVGLQGYENLAKAIYERLETSKLLVHPIDFGVGPEAIMSVLSASLD